MPRDRKGITQTRGNQRKDPTVFFVIAFEGTETEPFYFELISGLLSKLRIGRLIKVEPLRRLNKASSFKDVIKQLDDHKRTYSLKKDDELWCLIDRDNIPEKNAAQAHKLCKQKKYEFCLTSPCFELWLLLHFKDLSDFSPEELQSFLKNRKINSSKTVLEHQLNNETNSAFGKSYHKNAPPPELMDYMSLAMQRAFSNQLEKDWTFEDFCTRVHELVQRIFKSEPPDYKIPN